MGQLFCEISGLMCVVGCRAVLGHIDGVFVGPELVAHDVGREEAAAAGGFGDLRIMRHHLARPYIWVLKHAVLVDCIEVTELC